MSRDNRELSFDEYYAAIHEYNELVERICRDDPSVRGVCVLYPQAFMELLEKSQVYRQKAVLYDRLELRYVNTVQELISANDEIRELKKLLRDHNIPFK